MENKTRINPEQEILNPPVMRATQPEKTDKSKYDREVVLGTISERKRPDEYHDKFYFQHTCPECGTTVNPGSERCVCGLNLEDM